VEKTREQALAWEERWSVPTGVVTLVAVALLIASAVAISAVSTGGDAEVLRSVDEETSRVWISSILEAFGFALLLPPLYLLFRAAATRSTQMRGQLVGLVVAAPLFFAAAALLNAHATTEAADQFLAGEAKSTLSAKEAAADCREERDDLEAEEFGEKYDQGSSPQADCVATMRADDEADNAIGEASTRGLATGFGLGARLALAIGLFYACLHAMRVGLLTRFWGSLGMALAVAALLLLVQFTLIWFVYFGLLLIGRLPGGRPPAWASGEAIPWPTPGEKAAAELEAEDGEAIDVEPLEPDPDGPPDAGDGDADGRYGSERRKRKRRE